MIPRCGVGGHCVAIDPWFLINTFPHKTRLFQSARLTNDERPAQVVKNIEKKVQDWCVDNEKNICRVHLLGLTYKPNVDDLRESPAIKVAEALFAQKNISLSISEPNVEQERIAHKFGTMVPFEVGIEKADIIVALVAHNQFKTLDLEKYSDKKWLDFAGLGWQQKTINLCKKNQEALLNL